MPPIVWAGPTIQTVTADNVGQPEAVTPTMFCNRITIREAGGLGATAYRVRAPNVNSQPLLIGAGQEWVWQKQFYPGKIAFYIETVVGTVQFTVVFE